MERAVEHRHRRQHDGAVDDVRRSLSGRLEAELVHGQEVLGFEADATESHQRRHRFELGGPSEPRDGVMRRVATADGDGVAGAGELLRCVVAHGEREGKPSLVGETRGLVRLQQRFVTQALQNVDRPRRFVGRRQEKDLLGGAQIETAAEDGTLRQGTLLEGRQEVPGGIDGVPQGAPAAGAGGSIVRCEELEAARKPRHDLARRQEPHARSRELDRERVPIELAHQLADERRVVRAELVVSSNRARAIDEQLHGVGVRRQEVGVRHVQRSQVEEHLAGDP
jgi:hypothetical protein